MTDLVIDRSYARDKDGRDVVFFAVQILDETIAPPSVTDVSFSLEYVQITAQDAGKPDKKKTKGNPQTDFLVIGSGEAGKPTLLWQALGEQRFFVGSMKARFDWTGADGNPQFAETTFQAGDSLNLQSNVAISTNAPSLANILLTASPPSMAGDGTTLEQQVVDVIVGIHQRLEAGLKTAWIAGGAPTKGGKSYTEIPIAELTSTEDLEEAWAEHISELLVATTYSGCGPTYAVKNTDIYAKTIDIKDPGAALAYACENLATMACLTRGLDDAASDPLDSGNASPVERYTRGAGTTGTVNRDASNRVAATAIANDILAPGICYVVKPSIRHIAFVLRGLKPDRMQLLDTSAMWTADPSNNSPFEPNGGLNFDTPAAKEITAARKIDHIGVLPRASALGSAIERLRRTRPLGLGRLVLLRRDTTFSTPMRERLLYASPFIPLWNQTETHQNYYPALLCWSLRDHVHRDEITAWWMVDAPCRQPLRGKVLASRTFTWNTEYDKAQPVTPPHSLSVADIASKKDGGFLWTGSLVYTTKNNPNGETKWRNEKKKSVNAYKNTRRDPALEKLPIDAVHPGLTGDDLFVLKGCGFKKDGTTVNLKDPNGFPNRVVFKYEDYPDFPELFRKAP